MSRDIRSYFKTKPTTHDNDSDVIPESPQMQPKNKAKKTRRKRALSDDSDESSPKKKVYKKSAEDNQSGKKTKSSGKPLTEVKSSDLFGGGLIKRTEPLLKKQKTTETGIHSDNEFELSLLELDEIEEIESANTSKKIEGNKCRKEAIEGNKATDEITDSSKSESREKSRTENKTKEIVTNEAKANHKTKDSNKSKSKSESVKDDKTETNTNSTTKKNSSKAANDIMDKVTGNNKVETKTKVKCDNEMKAIIEPVSNTKGKKGSKQEEGSRLDKLKNNGVAKEAAKADFSEFIGDTDDEKLDTPKGKKRKLDKSFNDSVLTDEERHERKIASAALYKSYLNRSGPKHLGEKTIPQGSPDCLKDCAFVLTGVMDSFEKEDIAKAIANYGGCVKSSVTKKVTHVLAGDDAGPAKLAKAQELNIKVINEDEFLQMIVDRSKKDASKAKVKTEPESAKKKSNKVTSKSPTESKQPKSDKKHNSSTTMAKSHSDVKIELKKEKMNTTGDIQKSKSDGFSTVKKENVISDCRNDEKQAQPVNAAVSKSHGQTADAMLWVDKYKPQSSKNIIGQHGPASNVKKLTNWLTKWYANRKAKLPKPNPWAKNDDGAYYKAALLSGPPGVGKTTTVTLVCKELGFDLVEFNASDTRNKALIREQIGELLTTNSLSAYAKGDTSKQAVTKKHVLVMDEVDGMAGNEDRGGLQELIGLIKSTSVPIICTCNDRNSPKMRSLVNYCYDLRFKRPTVDQIKSALMSVCFKEGIKAPPDVLAQIAITAGQDVRHTLHLAALWAASPAATNPTNPPAPGNPTNRQRPEHTRPTKDVKLGPWDAVRKVFTASEHASMSINEKSDLFFYDYSLAPLFVQENYLQVVPHCPKDKVLSRVSMAADSISMGDLVEARIRGNQSWSLLPTQAMFSSVIPGHAMAGHVAGQIQFPGWLGKNSRAGKMRRLAQEIHAHTRLSTSGSKSSIFLDYCTHLRDAIINPMLKGRADGVAESLSVLQSYHLLREDLDSLIELSLWPGQRNPMILVESKVKAAMTRAYNKRAAALPYAPPEAKRNTKRDTNKDQQEESDVDEEDTDYEAVAAGY